MALKNHWTEQEIEKILDYYKERVKEPYCVKERVKFLALADMAKKMMALNLRSPIDSIPDHFTGLPVNSFPLKSVSDIRINEIPYEDIRSVWPVYMIDWNLENSINIDLVAPIGSCRIVKIGDMWFDAETYKTTVRAI